MMIDHYINDLNHKLDDDFKVVNESVPLPVHWRAYLAKSQEERLENLIAELNLIEPVFSETASKLKQIATDAIVVQSCTGRIMRIIIRGLEDRTPLYFYSALPLKYLPSQGDIFEDFLISAPVKLNQIYRDIMNGLTDIYDFGGFKNSTYLFNIESEAEIWTELPWFEEYFAETKLTHVFEVFSSGGTASLLFDPARKALQGIVADYADEYEKPFEVDFLAYLDEWMAISLGE